MGKSIGQNIRAKRKTIGITQGDFARKLGMRQPKVSRIEASEQGPSADVLLKIAREFGCDVRELLGVDGVEETASIGNDVTDFIFGMMKVYPQIGSILLKISDESKEFSERDFIFCAGVIETAINYARDVILFHMQ